MSEARRGDKNPAWKGGISSLPEKKAEYARLWRKQNEDYVRDREYKKRFGITLDDYDALLNSQNGLCAICGKTCERGRLSVDHNHSTGNVRGLLCRKCNAVIGMFNDDTELIKKAGAYLVKNER